MKTTIIQQLLDKGVNIPNPESVYISNDINPENISGDNVTIYSGCKLIGEHTLIMRNCTIGYEAPVTLEDTQVGENSELKGGYFKSTVFAGHNQVGSGAHFREGTILEEEANAAHTVGLKQTILFPFVTLGSLINFCDCFMAGGTNRKNHSEVGSSFIHFNYTPNQDKATPSMMGDVSQGVMLRSKPVFLGGQGGLVGPVRITYGCISAAGSIIRKNEIRPDRLILGGSFKDMSLKREYDVYKNVTHIFNNNVQYIAGLIALKHWYAHVRCLFITGDHYRALVTGMQTRLESCINERIKRFKVFCEKLLISRKKLLKKNKDKTSEIIRIHNQAIETGNKALEIFSNENCVEQINSIGKEFINCVKVRVNQGQSNYIDLIQALDDEEQDKGMRWLEQIEQNVLKKIMI